MIRIDNSEKSKHIGQFLTCLGIIFAAIDYGRELAYNQGITIEQATEFLNNFFFGYADLILQPMVYFGLIIVGLIFWFLVSWLLRNDKEKPKREPNVNVNTNVPISV